MPSSDEDDEMEDGLEEAYAAKLVAQRLKAEAEGQKNKKRKAEEDLDEDEADSDDSEDDGPLDINDLVHETLAGKPVKKEKKAKKDKEVDPKKAEKAKKRAEESPDERDARTIFIGNVPSDCSTSNVSSGFDVQANDHGLTESLLSQSRKKALVRHVLQSPALLADLPPNCPPLKLDSIRFRSIAFASKVFGRKANAAGGTDGESNSAEAGGRGRKRAKEWRENEGSDQRGVRGGFKAREEEPQASTSKSGALTDGQKRRVAFIRGELNEHKAACNAYLVIEDFTTEAEDIPMSEVIQLLVEHTNNSIFDGFTLRADHVRPRSAAAVLAAAQMAAKPNPNLIDVPKSADAATYQITATEARRTLFVGGLDFAETEENVRKATEAVLVRERGEIKGQYVENVRIVRDASTGLGKGFCYVLLTVSCRFLFWSRSAGTHQCIAVSGRAMRRRASRAPARKEPQDLEAQGSTRTMQDLCRCRSFEGFGTLKRPHVWRTSPETRIEGTRPPPSRTQRRTSRPHCSFPPFNLGF